MDLNEISIFVKVVQSGSFSRAAKTLGIPNSTVSTKVSLLEKRLGITLLQRTTRRLHLTEAGETYFKRCVEALDAIQAAETEAASAQGAPRGLLRLTAPVEMGSSVLPGIIGEFLANHPEVKIELLLSDRVVDLVAEGVDVAIRAGDLEDSALISRKLGYTHFAPYASPRYLKRHGIPAHPRDLAKHRCLGFSAMDQEHWVLTNGKETQKVRISGPVVANDLLVLRMLACQGQGVALLPMFLCRETPGGQNLERVLPEWFSDPEPVHLVYPQQRYLSPKLKVFLEFATERLRGALV